MVYTYDKGRTLKGAVINEMLFGQSQTACERLMVDLGVSMNIDSRRFRLCLTGIPKQVYAPRFGKDLDDFFRLYGSLEDEMARSLSEFGIAFDAAIVKYDGTKRILYLLSPSPSADRSLEAAELLHRRILALYRSCWGLGDDAYVCVTALSEELRGFESLAEGFVRTRNLAKLSFFLDRSLLMTDDEYRSRHVPLSADGLASSLKRIESLIVRSSVEELEEAVRVLFFEQLRSSFSLRACSDALSEIRSLARRYNEVFLARLDSARLEGLSLEGHDNLKTVYEEARAVLVHCARASSRTGLEVGRLSLEAVRFIRERYAETFTVDEIAREIGVSPNYLSRVFNGEIGESIPSYVAKVRLARAMQLIETSDATIADIGARCGFSSAAYFNRVFKQKTGWTPARYRERKRA